MKYLKLILVGLVALFPTVGFASTAYFSPSAISVKPGQVVSVTVIVGPQGQSAYTAKIGVSFPANLLSVSSFTQASGWLPLTQPGYDAVDNSNGTLVKTGGMAGGLSSPQAFGTITFVAKAAGTAIISINGSTQILNSSSQNTFAGGGQASISISQPAAQPVETPVTQPTQSKPNPARNLKTNKTQATTTLPAATSTATATEETASSTVLAAQAVRINPSLALSVIIPLLTFAAGFSLGQKLKF
jgi:hypothetical protein